MCVYLAVKPVVGVWLNFEKERGIEGLAERYFAAFHGWLDSTGSQSEFEATAHEIELLLPEDLRKVPDPAFGMVGYAMLDIKLTALDQCWDDDMDFTEDIFATGIRYAAAVYGKNPTVRIVTEFKDLNDLEREFMETWWRECCVRFPELNR